jgi:hypothetical protein
MKKYASLIIAVWFTSQCANAQGTFQNFNFESANLSPETPGPAPNYVPISSALPAWTVYIGTAQQTQVEYNVTTLGNASVDILGPNWTGSLAASESGYGIIDGKYTVVLQSGEYTNTDVYSASLSQNGTIPGNAQSLQFEADNGAYALSVSFAGNNLPLNVLSSGLSPSGIPYTVYGVDIAPYSSQTGLLEFTESFSASVELDDISFSTTAVAPEPSTLALILTGGVAFAASAYRARDARSRLREH